MAKYLVEIYVVYLQTYLKVYFHLLKLITELITDKYLSKHRCKKTVSKIKKKRINNTLMSCYFETGGKLLRYLNIILNGSTFEHVFFSLINQTIITTALKI